MDVKLRILAIERMLSDKGITVKEIIEKLENQYSISADRKTIYDDLNALTFFLPLVQEKKGVRNVYFIEQAN